VYYMEKLLKKDREEDILLDLYPTSTQRRLGRFADKEIHVKYTSIDLKKHLARLNRINTKVPKVDYSVKKPVKTPHIDKRKVHGNMPKEEEIPDLAKYIAHHITRI
jgi:hypothetical protein